MNTHPLRRARQHAASTLVDVIDNVGDVAPNPREEAEKSGGELRIEIAAPPGRLKAPRHAAAPADSTRPSRGSDQS